MMLPQIKVARKGFPAMPSDGGGGEERVSGRRVGKAIRGVGMRVEVEVINSDISKEKQGMSFLDVSW